MAIPESQLVTWSHQGSIQSSSRTYDSIKNCINNGLKKDGLLYDIYLQGSYKNSTNIYGDSDVDIIVELMSTFNADISNLDAVGRQVYETFPPATYTLSEFKKEVVRTLKGCYGDSAVNVGNKAVKVKGKSSRLNADVLVCNKYNRYNKNYGSATLSAVKGIRFVEEHTGKTVINYPIPHYDNGVAKNLLIRTQSNLKKVTRIFKNMKATLVNHQAMRSATAPSYFVECLIYNAQDQHFRQSTFQSKVQAIVSQFIQDDRTNSNDRYVCQNEQRYLFGDGDQQWNKADAREYIRNLIYVWDNYPL